MLKNILKIVEDPILAAPKYTARVLPVMFAPAAMFITIFFILHNLGIEPYLGVKDGPDVGYTAFDFISIVLLVPVIETYLLIAVIWSVCKVIHKNLHIAFFSALFFSVLHSLQEPIWGIFVFWPFFVYSLILISRNGSDHRGGDGVFIVITLHALNNFFIWVLGYIDGA
ncbi:MAG: hypothetical protein DSZ28_09660 [Thiothrix sp.]|nr:MAG: hypothetical protein DSZ28_09660 [Thiothrix sp.]